MGKLVSVNIDIHSIENLPKISIDLLFSLYSILLESVSLIPTISGLLRIQFQIRPKSKLKSDKLG